MGAVRSFRDLDVYQRAFDATLRIYEISKLFPAYERYALTDQIRRASRSVCTNIAEAWRKRSYPAHFASKLSGADAEAAETQAWLDFARAHKYIGSAQHTELDDLYDHTCAQLRRMMDHADDWRLPSRPTNQISRRTTPES